MVKNKEFFKIALINKYSFFTTTILTIIYAATYTFANYAIAFLARIITNSNKYNYLQVIFTNLPLVIGSWLLYLFVGYITGLVRNRLKQQFKTNVRKNIVDKIFSLDYKEYKDMDNGKFMSWFSSDIEKITNNSFVNFFLMVNSLFILIFSIISMFLIEYTLAVACFAIALLTLIIPKIFDKLLEKESKILTHKNENFTEKVKNIILGYDVLLLSNNKEKFREKIIDYSTEIENYEYKYNMA